MGFDGTVTALAAREEQASAMLAESAPSAADTLDQVFLLMSLRQARRLAKNLAGDLQPYRYRMLGQAATLGRNKGVLEGHYKDLEQFWADVTKAYRQEVEALVVEAMRIGLDLEELMEAVETQWEKIGTPEAIRR